MWVNLILSCNINVELQIAAHVADLNWNFSPKMEKIAS